ncbi:hypothetical protein CY34DRAFT_810147 [Suillus luteus UH-Slu-Lm8-n1]|uniref:Uncharacterized protein n=1 Tax=Suillus luteus UH-Slu-Lm8-n1 TaxID=930992 RepID=A0A0D0A7L8_9AGAM|nr:hypothetical protein CY34DRAFT_810147 [Suillus luteus UH-Slu-Lm8-n1]
MRRSFSLFFWQSSLLETDAGGPSLKSCVYKLIRKVYIKFYIILCIPDMFDLCCCC